MDISKPESYLKFIESIILTVIIIGAAYDSR